jgi:hypothetical protein
MNRMSLRKITGSRTVIAVVVALSLVAGATALAGVFGSGPRVAGATGTGEDDRLISVTGTGEITMEPNICRLTVGVQNEALTAEEAEQANSDAVNRVIAQILSLGIRKGDIKTAGFNLYPVYDYSKETGEKLTPIGFRCAHRLQVTVRDLDQVGQVIDQAVSSGGNTVDDVSYAVEETDALREQVLTKAVQQASSKANAIAKAINATVVSIKSIQEHGVDFGVYRTMYEAAGAGAAAPVMPGEITIRASVSMTVRF